MFVVLTVASLLQVAIPSQAQVAPTPVAQSNQPTDAVLDWNAIVIPQANQLGNPGITPDPNWEALIVTPNHPDYISGHCVTTGADERVLQNFFSKDAVKVSLIFPANAGVTRSFTRFSQISKELGEARIWAGVHTHTADTQGDVLGKAVGDYVFQNVLRPLNG